MGEGLAALAGSLNTVRSMATRDIYETGFDEDVRAESSANQCPSVTAESLRTRSKQYAKIAAWLSMESESTTGRSGGRMTTRSANERAHRPQQLATIEACRRRSVVEPTRGGTNSPERSDGDSRGCDVNRPVVTGGRKQNGISHIGWAKCDG